MTLLKKGDTVAFISPSGWISQKDLSDSLKWFKKQGLKVILSKNIFKINGYTAGCIKDRVDDIHDAFLNKKVKAIFCTRGGAGSSKILDELNYDLIKKNKKPVFGLSDSTALQNALYTKTGLVSYTGFLPIYDFKTHKLNEQTEQSLLNIFQGHEFCYPAGGYIKKGSAEGILVGGCLSVFTLLCGSVYFPNLKDKILLIEDIGEKSYRIDLMLEQLRMQKGFNQIKGIIFGKFNNCLPSDAGDENIDEIIRNFCEDLNVPVLFNFPYGHVREKFILPIGKKVAINTNLLTIQSLNYKFGENTED